MATRKTKDDATPTRRRPKGEGTIYQREDGRWVGQIDLGYMLNPQGKSVRHRPTVTGDSQADVREQMNKLRYERDRGTLATGPKQTVAQFLDYWLTEVIGPNRRPATVKSYRLLVDRHIVPAIGKTRLDKLTAQDVQKLLNAKAKETVRASDKKEAKKLSPRTVQYIRGVLRAALNKAVKLDLIARNVAMLVDTPTESKPEIRFLTIEEAVRLINAAKDDRLEALYRVALSLGLRQGEAFGLRWDDVTLDKDPHVRIRHALQIVDGKPVLVEPKTQLSRRRIDIPPELAIVLRTHRKAQLQERLIAGSRWNDLNFVFATPIGTPLDPSNLRRQFRALLHKAGLEPMRFHDLRHTAASLLVAEGVHPRTVMRILGHSQIAITMNTYAHIYDQTVKEATGLVGKRLFAGDASDASAANE